MNPRHRFYSVALTVALFATSLALAIPAHAISTRTLITPLGGAAGDRLGHSVSDAGDWNADGHADVIVGAPFYAGQTGRAYLYFGGPGADDVADLTLTGEVAGDRFGYSVSSAGDFNGDGFADVIVGGYFNNAGGTNAGRAYVYFGGPGADAIADLTLTGMASQGQFGYSVSGGGDINLDGYADVIAGAAFEQRAYVFYGGPGADTVADLIFSAPSGGSYGWSVWCEGDLTGDGSGDCIVGAPFNTTGGSDAGEAYVYYGGPGADTIKDLTLTGVASETLGWSVSGAGDVNDDGSPDLIVGAPAAVGGGLAGQAFVYYGGPLLDTVADVTLTGDISNWLGYSVSDAGDVNGDGVADVVVGEPLSDALGLNHGCAYVYYGRAGTPDATADIRFTGETNQENLGYSVSGAGNFGMDGLPDVIASARENGEAGIGAGKAYVYDVFQYVLTSPNGGETWPVGSLQSITWLGRDLAQVSLSTDGGLTFSALDDRVGGLAENELELRVPHAPTRFAMVKIEPVSASLSGEAKSDSLFTIESSVSLLTFTVAARPGGGAELAWSSEPAVGPQGIAGYRLYRSGAGAAAGDLGRQIGPSLIGDDSYVDDSGAQGSTYRLTAVNGLGEELELGREMLAPSAPLAAWPLPYRGGLLNVSFASAGEAFSGGPAPVNVSLYDAAGRRIRTLAEGVFQPGTHTTIWDGRDANGQRLPSGIYFLNLRIENNSRQMKIVVAP